VPASLLRVDGEAGEVAGKHRIAQFNGTRRLQ